MPVDEAVRIAVEVADALDYAHRHGMVHRDIKPENILLHEGHAVVADFGIGKALVAAARPRVGDVHTDRRLGRHSGIHESRAGRGRRPGRPERPLSLGCILYEMLTGDQAFTGPTVQAVIAKRFHHVPPRVNVSRPSVPEAVSRTVERLLEISPEHRFSSGTEVVRALHGDVEVTTMRREMPSIAVLPFANMSADRDNAFFSDGITDDITVPHGVQGLRVAARASAFTFKGRDAALSEIGEKLSVRNVLSGSVRRAGNRVRVTAQLMETDDGTQRWSDRYDRDLDDIFTIQDEISHSIVAELEVILGVHANVPLVVRPTGDIEAYELYLRGREAIRVRTPSSLKRGRELFAGAIQRDPSFTRAWLGLTEAFAATGVYAYEPWRYCRQHAEEALEHAAKISGEDPDVSLYRAFVKLYMRLRSA